MIDKQATFVCMWQFNAKQGKPGLIKTIRFVITVFMFHLIIFKRARAHLF